jgi:hypothetical protein
MCLVIYQVVGWSGECVKLYFLYLIFRDYHCSNAKSCVAVNLLVTN